MKVWIEEIVSMTGSHLGRVFYSWETAKKAMESSEILRPEHIHEEDQSIVIETRSGGIIIKPHEVIKEIGEPLYVLRLWDMFDGWMDVSDPVSKEQADKLYNEKTSNGLRNTRYSDGDYYKVFPAGTKMVFTPEYLGR